MDDLVEKAARAIVTAGGDDPDGPWSVASPEPTWTCYVEEARAAIRAVLDAIAEPSEAMKKRGAEEISGNDNFWASDFPDEAIRVWRAMIAALRKELGQ